jgi:hypothetical protein
VLHSKLRRTLAVVVVAAAVSLPSVQAAGALPGGGRGRATTRSLHAIQHWRLLEWNLLASLLTKVGMRIDPEGIRAQLEGNG